MDAEIHLALWNYFWREVDGVNIEESREMCTLKMLASIGYQSALAHLGDQLGECLMPVKQIYEETDTSTLSIDFKSLDSETLPDLADFLADSPPPVYDFEVDSEGVVEVEYLNLLPNYTEDKLLWSSEEEEDVSTAVDDTFCFTYNYGGPEAENTQGWDRLGLLPDPWAEARHPTVEMLTSENLTADEIEPNLNILTLSSGLGNLALTPGLEGYGYTKLQLPSKGIRSVELLQYYPYLQYVDLANNSIEDPSPLWKITQLIVLDLSNNKLTDESINMPDQILFLTYINLSHNKFTKIPDLSNCWAIKHFDLAHNMIQRIEHLIELKYLNYLNLSYNKLEYIDNLNNRLLKEVNFAHNAISSWDSPRPRELSSLENINISFNKLPSLAIFAEMYNLTTLDVSYNKISAMSEFDALKTLPVVTNLKIAGNEINTLTPDPRRLIIYLLPSIKILDGVPISSMERVSSVSTFASNPLEQMVCQAMRSFYYTNSRTPTVGWERLKVTGEHPALIILVGDIGSSRKVVINMVHRMAPQICKEVKVFTTRPRVHFERSDSRVKYVSLKKFNTIEKEGRFFVVERRFGHKYGIEIRELEDKNRVLLTFMGMTAALEVLWNGFNPTLIIMCPNQEEILTKRCFKWFSSSDVYRTRFKIRRVSRRRRRPESLLLGDDDSDDDDLNIIKRKITDPPKNVIRLIKSNLLFKNPGKKKWNIHKYTENLGLNRKILDECYGRYITNPHKETTKVKASESPGSHVSFGVNPQNNVTFSEVTASTRSSQGSVTASTRSSQGSMSEENELRRFVENILRNQMSYRSMHIKNPGLFQLFISSDNYEKASQTLLEVIKSLYIKLEESKKTKTVDLQSDPNYNSLVKDPIMELLNDVTAHDLPLDIAI